jgi:hypothetical protein
MVWLSSVWKNPSSHGLQSSSKVAVNFVSKYSPGSHLDRSVQTRLEVLVGATVWYWLLRHVSRARHARLEVAVGAFDSYCVLVQLRKGLQSVWLVSVPAAAMNSSFSQDLCGLHSILR